MARAVTPTDPEEPTVAVAGLRVPASLVPRIVAALRSTYPTVTEGRDDNAAVRAVLRLWIKTILTAYEAQAAAAPATKQANALLKKALAAEETARAAAEAAASRIVDEDPATEPGTSAAIDGPLDLN